MKDLPADLASREPSEGLLPSAFHLSPSALPFPQPLPLPLSVSAARSRWTDFLALTKPRLNLLVVASTVAGFYLGATDGIALRVLLHVIIGTALVAGGAAALNQVSERTTDAIMRRTRTRPLPDGRLQPAEATRFGAAMAGVGLVELAVGAHWLAAAVAMATLVTYLAVYTPLKRRTPLATLVGAVPGALPPLIGWAASRGSLSIEAWVLFAIVFFWQMPHFLAIAWMYREDYARAGFPLLAVVEPDGVRNARHALLFTLALVGASILPRVLAMAGDGYLIAVLLLGTGLLAAAVNLVRRRTFAAARTLFLGSITYLPLLWLTMIVDRVR